MVYHRLQPEDAYTPYDPTRSGTVTEQVFRRGLSDAYRMTFSDAQLDTLTKRYRHGTDKARREGEQATCLDGMPTKTRWPKEQISPSLVRVWGYDATCTNYSCSCS